MAQYWAKAEFHSFQQSRLIVIMVIVIIMVTVMAIVIAIVIKV